MDKTAERKLQTHVEPEIVPDGRPPVLARRMMPGGSATLEAPEAARRAATQALQRPWVVRLARSGYVAKGVVYVVCGILAVEASFGAIAEEADPKGALQALARQPFGALLLAVVGCGLLFYALWRLTQGGLDTEQKGRGFGGYFQRMGFVLSGLAYGLLGASAFRLIYRAAQPRTEDQVRSWTAWLMAEPSGRWLVGLAGAWFVGLALAQFLKAYTAQFRSLLLLEHMTRREDCWLTRVARFGITAQGLVMATVGLFLIQAAIQYDPAKAHGLGGALQEVARRPSGPWLVRCAAIGLIAFGTYLIALARYRRIGPPGAHRAES